MLSNDKSVVRYAISAAVTAYDIDFPFWDFSEIVVTATNSATGASVVLKKDVDYTITVSEAITDPVYQDGTINMISDTYKSYDALVISRELSLTQDTDYKNGEPINADTLEMSLDRATAQIQQVAEEAGHAMKLPFTEDAGDYTLPEASQRQRKVLGFDSDGKTLVMFSNPDDAIKQANDANAQSSQILQDVTTLKGQAEDAKEAAEEAQGKAEDAQAAAEQAKADTQEIADEAETTIGNSNTTGLRGEAVTAIQTALENALASIGESDSAGARGDAIEAITAALNAALAEIGQTDSTGARGEALTAIATALTNALAAIGQSNDAGARGAAITAISQALANALNAIGESNSAGARGDAISAIAEALSEALASIGTNDTAGARGDAITAIENALNAALSSWNQQVSSDNTAWDSKVNDDNSAWDSKVETDNSAFDAKVAQANTTIDQKLSEASGYADDAETAKNAAEAAQAAAEEAAAEAAAIVDIGPATESTLGLVKISGNARGTATDTAVSQAGMKAELDNIDDELDDRYTKAESYSRNEIDQKLADAASILPIPLVEAVFNATGTGLQIVMNNNYIGYGNVTVRYKIGGDPSETDAVATFPITNVQTGTYYFRAFPASGSLDEPSPSAILTLDTSKVMTPTYQWDDITDSISFACQTPAADIRYTTDGLEPTATSGTPYTGPIALTAQTTFKVKAFKGGMADSDTLSVTITKVATPTFSFQKNGETGTVTMGCSTASAVIKYTTDDTEPTENNGTVYNGPITLNGTSTKYRIKAFLSGCIDSEEVQGDAMFAMIWAVRLNLASSSTALERLTPETDPLEVVTETIATEPIPEITGTQAGSSPFDGTDFWDAIKRRNFNDDGTPGAWEGEEGFTLTDKDVMVWIPKFWYRIVNDTEANFRYYYLSDSEADGFKLHPGSGQYVAAYETSSNNQSRSGKTVQVSQTRATFRTNARAKGAGWQLCDAAERNAINLLYLIEFADTNCQAKIGAGRSSSSNSAAISTGSTDVMTYHTGRPSGTEGQVGVKYRGMENLWGNVFEWTDGANFINRVPYYSTDRDSYADDTTTGYTACGGPNPGDGYITKQRYVEALDWCISQPDAVGGSETTYFPDYHYYNSGDRLLAVGGSWDNGGVCGLFYWRCYSASSDTYSYFGSRLSYKDAS